jgi:hypothetical protein
MSIPSNNSPGPHNSIPVDNARDQLAANLFDRLWERYRERVSYVAQYEQVIRAAGARFVNDHIAFRTFASQQPLAGIASVSRVFESLGYVAAGLYQFPDKHLNAVHFQHPVTDFPKLFISELRTWELPREARALIANSTSLARPELDLERLASIAALATQPAQSLDEQSTDPALLDELVEIFHALPWDFPDRQDVERLNGDSQYAAGVLVHGYNVNHFTSLINSHAVPALDDIEKTIEALQAVGVPMKAEIEGERGSKLRQTATEAVRIAVSMREGSRVVQSPWSYAYFELAERGNVTDPDTGKPIRFEGFLGPQATNLFEMTRLK